MSKILTRYELVMTPEAVAEMLRTGSRHKIEDGLPHEFGEEPDLVSADIDDRGYLRLVFVDRGAEQAPPIAICKPLTITTLEELP
jgi:hypothetical protein